MLFEGGPSELLEVPELHPENAERVRNMRSVLERGPLRERLRWRDGRIADEAELAAVHYAGVRRRDPRGVRRRRP